MDDLLRSWNVSDDVIAKFQAESIDVETLGILQEKDWFNFFPNIGSRARFREKWTEFVQKKDNVHVEIIYEEPLSAETEANAIASNNTAPDQILTRRTPEKRSSTEQNPLDDEKQAKVIRIISPVKLTDLTQTKTPISSVNDLRKVIGASQSGKGILRHHESKKELSNGHLTNVAKVVVDNEIGFSPVKKIESKTLTFLAGLLSTLFPETKSELWYSPFKQGKCGEKIFACGKLHDAYNRLRQHLLETGAAPYLKPRKKKKQNRTPEEVLQETQEGAEDQRMKKINVLHKTSEPAQEIELYWRQTYEERKKLWNILYKSVEGYFKFYPALNLNNGFELLLSDFDVKYPNQANTLTDNWPDFRELLLNCYRRKAVSDRPTRKLLHEEDISLTETDEKLSTVNTIRLLAAVSSVCKPVKGTKGTWKIDKGDAIDSVIVSIKSNADLKNEIEKKRNNFFNYGLTFQPFLVVVSTTEAVDDTYVVFSNIRYHFESPIKALDCLFKCYQVLETSYPPANKGFWLFVQQYLYNITTEFDQVMASVRTLQAALEREKELQAKELRAKENPAAVDVV